MTKRLTGKVAVVTGAASGIGAATARRLVADGAQVVLADLDAEGLGRIESELGSRVVARTGDVSTEDFVKEIVETAAERYGRLDILHNNAATTFPGDLDVATTADAVWKKTFDLIVMAAVWSCRHGIPIMRETGGGSIINTSSGAGRTATASRVAYGTAKGALETLTIYTATVYGPEGIRCNAVTPGFVLTEATRQLFDDDGIAQFGNTAAAGRLCLPEDVADVVAFLASDDARYVSGQSLVVNGGGSRGFSW